MEHILRIIDKDLDRRIKEAAEFIDKYNDLKKENEKLKAENKMLRNDLFELSKEQFKKLND